MLAVLWKEAEELFIAEFSFSCWILNDSMSVKGKWKLMSHKHRRYDAATKYDKWVIVEHQTAFESFIACNTRGQRVCVDIL